MSVQLTEKEKIARSMLCLPLDGLTTLQQAEDRVIELAEYVGVFKVGKGLFTKYGPEAVEMVHRNGCKVFLDLKFHDIPNTVQEASKAATEMGVYMFNVHAAGGVRMMKAAMKGVDEACSEAANNCLIQKPIVIAVTVLTSLEPDEVKTEVGFSGTVESNVLRFAKYTVESGLDGTVSSALDLSEELLNELPNDFYYVTPGVGLKDGQVGSDQSRIVTPGEAIRKGSKLIVAGRTITIYKTDKERKTAAYSVLKDMAQALE